MRIYKQPRTRLIWIAAILIFGASFVVDGQPLDRVPDEGLAEGSGAGARIGRRSEECGRNTTAVTEIPEAYSGARAKDSYSDGCSSAIGGLEVGSTYEPITMLIFGAGLVGVGYAARRRFIG